MRDTRWRRWICLAVFLGATVLPLGAQQQTGNLYGTLTDTEGNALPGVTVTLSGAGAPGVQITDAQGRFRFLGLDAGDYSLEASLDGFSTVEYPEVTIRGGRDTTLEVELSPAVEEVITISSEAPLRDERKIQAGTTVSEIELEKIPTARDPWAVLRATPGVLTDRNYLGDNPTGELIGRAVDESGAPLPGANVLVRGDHIDGSRGAATNANGEFRLSGLPPGTYEVTINFIGYTTLRMTDVEVTPGSTKAIKGELSTDVLDLDAVVVTGLGRVADVTEQIQRHGTVLDVTFDEDETATVTGQQLVMPIIPSSLYNSISGTVIDRERANGDRSLGVGLDGHRMDRLDIGIGYKFRRDLQVGFITAGWDYDNERGSATGPATESFRVRFDFSPGTKFPKRIDLNAYLDGAQVWQGKLDTESRPKVETAGLDALTGLPRVISPGQPFYFTMGEHLRRELPWDLIFDYAGGGSDWSSARSWTVERFHLNYGSRWESGIQPGNLSPGTQFSVPPIVLEGNIPIQVTGTDEWGETRCEGVWNPIIIPDLSGAAPAITDVPRLTLPGQNICVCGQFYDPGHLSHIQIGGNPFGAPTGASSSVATFIAPSTLPPGEARVGWTPDFPQGTEPGGPHTSDVIKVEASIDFDVINRGGTTPLRLRVLGTERALPVGLKNRNIDSVRMDPANDITTQTSGGPDNKIGQVNVTGLKVGKFKIDWVIDTGSCPCEETLPQIAEVADSELDLLLSALYGFNPLRLDVAPGTDAPTDPNTVPELSFTPRLSFLDDRFRVQVHWQDFNGNTGQAQGMEFDDRHGGFYLSNPDNLDMLIKMLDNCELNNNFWVFSAATTNVEYTLTVTDTDSGHQKQYFNPLGSAAPAITDTSAFATCP